MHWPWPRGLLLLTGMNLLALLAYDNCRKTFIFPKNQMTPPIPLTLLICDHVWRDPNSGKHHLLGTFSAIGSSIFPLVTNLSVYFAVTEGQGQLPVRLEFIDVDEERPAVVDAEGMFQFGHLRQVIDGTFNFSNLIFPEPGEYRLKLFVAGEFLMERSLHITVSPRPVTNDT